MEISKQEEILNKLLSSMDEVQISNDTIVKTIRDCFAISRLENEIYSLAKIEPLNDIQKERMKEAYNELEEISKKY